MGIVVGLLRLLYASGTMRNGSLEPRPQRHALPAAALLALLLVGASAAPAPGSSTWPDDDVTRRTFDVGATGRFHLDSERGTVEVVVGGEGTVNVEVVRSPGPRRSVEDFALSFEQRGDDVYVHGRFTDGTRHARGDGDRYGVRYRVVLPRRFDATLQTALGDVAVGDLDGDLTVRSSAASLEIGEIGGDVSAETSAGGIELEGAGGDATLRTSAGSIEVGRVGGDLHARGSAGNVEVDGVGGTLAVATSAGNVEATLLRAPRQDAEVETSAGNITLRVPTGAAFVVDAVARGGRVDVDLPRDGGGYARAPRADALHQTVGGGGPTLRLRTSQGTITVRQTP